MKRYNECCMPFVHNNCPKKVINNFIARACLLIFLRKLKYSVIYN